MLDIYTITIVVVSAAVASLNPYTIGVLILLSTISVGSGHPIRRMLSLGGIYIATIFALSLTVGLVGLYILHILPDIAASYLMLGVGLLSVSAGLLDIKNYFWYDRSPSPIMPQMAIRNIRSLTRTQPKATSAISLGAFVAMVTAPNSLVVYIALLSILSSSFNGASIGLVTVYNLLFVLPLVMLLQVAANGAKLSSLQRWKEINKHRMRLANGLVAIALGWIVILINCGVLNFG